MASGRVPKVTNTVGSDNSRQHSSPVRRRALLSFAGLRGFHRTLADGRSYDKAEATPIGPRMGRGGHCRAQSDRIPGVRSSCTTI